MLPVKVVSVNTIMVHGAGMTGSQPPPYATLNTVLVRVLSDKYYQCRKAAVINDVAAGGMPSFSGPGHLIIYK